MPRCRKPQLLRTRTIEQPCAQRAVLNKGHSLIANAFAVERFGTQTAQAVWVVNDIDPLCERLLVHPVLEKTDAAGDRTPRNGADEMSEQTRSHTRFIDDRHRLRFGLARIEPLHSSLPRAPANVFRPFQIGAVARAYALVVALHPRAFACQHGHADAMVRGGIAAEEAFAGGKRNRAAAETGAAPFGVGDARNCHCGALDRARPFHEYV